MLTQLYRSNLTFQVTAVLALIAVAAAGAQQISRGTHVTVQGEVFDIVDPLDHPFWGDYRILYVDDGSGFPSGLHPIICAEPCLFLAANPTIEVGDRVAATARLDSTFQITGALGDPGTQLVLVSVKRYWPDE